MSAAEAIAPEQSVDEVRQSLSVTDKGKTANTIDNCRIVFCCDPLLRDAIRLNLLTDRVDIVQDLGWRRNTSALTDTDVKYLLLYFERNYELTSEKKITAALSIVANENCYHPIQDVLNSLVWDGTPRIRSCLHHFLGADESDYVEEMLKHFLLGAIRRVFRPGSKYEEMLCLVGGQGAGKSTFFRLLAIRDEWFSDDLKKLDDDRVFQKLQGHWIIEMSEMLATSSAKSIEEIRSFISRQKETYRTPYESQPKDRLRQCVFGGSSNTLDFLPLDRAGNRRFLPIMIYPENAEVHILEDEDASRAYKKKIGALILAGTMLLSMGTTAFAAGESTTPNVNQNGQVPITKKFEMADGLTTPAATFKFTATSQTPGALPATIADVSFTEGQTGTLKGEKYVLEGTTAISFQGTWPHAGEYVYTVTEKQESILHFKNSGKEVEAVKKVREITGMDLVEAKQYVDSL